MKSARALCRPALVAALLLSPLAASAKPEAFEVTADTVSLLPLGREADGIIGDFVLRNDLVEAVISANLPNRRANMSTFYGPDGITPGCLYDLSLRGAHNDQITIFCPAQQQGRVSWVRILTEPRDNGRPEAAVECVTTAEAGDGIARRHVYRLQDGWPGLRITTTLTNATSKPRKIPAQDRWTNFLQTGFAPGGILWANSVDPADHCGYAVGPLEDPSNALSLPPLEIPPGASLTFTRFLAVGTSPAAAVGAVASQQGITSSLTGSITGPDGAPVADASLWLRPLFKIDVPHHTPPKTGATLPDSNGRLSAIATPDASGRFDFALPPGRYRATVTAPGRPNAESEIQISSGSATRADFHLDPASRITLDIRDEAGAPIPCKAQFLALDGTEPVRLGPDQRAHGCRDQYHSENGQFTVGLPAGRYRVVVTRGIEYNHLEREVEIAPGANVPFTGTLKRLVDTRGWVSADYHNHSTPSGDNICGTPDRLINLAAEHVEFAPTTEHNRLFDWRPEINRLGLAPFLQTVSGMELTGQKAHLNAFPFEPVPFTQNNGAPTWDPDPRITALTLREWQKVEADRWIQINHPDLFANFFEDRSTGQQERGFAGLVSLIDGYETQNSDPSRLLSGLPFSIGRSKEGTEQLTWSREFLWLQMLNQGRRTAAVAVCDAHAVFGNGVGGWRMYLPSASDNPAQIDWRENIRAAKAGRSYLTTGPFLQARTADGIEPGGTARPSKGLVTLHVSVQCTDWIAIDRVQVLVNGRTPPELNFTRASHPQLFKEGVLRFQHTIPVKLTADAHLIVAVSGDNDSLKTCYGSSDQSKLKPFAYHNPILVDIDGNGFTPNGDDLGFPVTGKRITLDAAKAFLEARKQNH